MSLWAWPKIWSGSRSAFTPRASAPGGRVWRVRYTGRADFTASAVNGAAPLTVSFADTSDAPAGSSRAWDFGDGAASAETSPTHTFARPGRYAVTLTRAGRDGSPIERLRLITVADAAGRIPDPAPTRDTPAPAPAGASEVMSTDCCGVAQRMARLSSICTPPRSP